MALKLSLSVEDTAKLCKLGFQLTKNERGRKMFLYEAGSIANWKRVKIEPAFDDCSLAHDENYVPCVYVTVESEKEAGYVEVDWQYRKHGRVCVDKLFQFLESEGISLKTSRERLEEFRTRHREVQILRAKLEEAGFDVKEVERLLG
jgi:hypothetical protein